jgi:hypothetical protein
MALNFELSTEQTELVGSLMRGPGDRRSDDVGQTIRLELPPDVDGMIGELATERGLDPDGLLRDLFDMFLTRARSDPGLEARLLSVPGLGREEALPHVFAAFIREGRDEIISIVRLAHRIPRPLTGRELVEFWRKNDALGVWSDRSESSVELATRMRRRSERRTGVKG